MTNEEFQNKLKETYDNLTKEQFDYLLQCSKLKLAKLHNEDESILINIVNDGNDYVMTGFTQAGCSDNEFLSANVYLTVKNSRKITFKQFKSLSWFSGVNWIEQENKKEETEYKQF